MEFYFIWKCSWNIFYKNQSIKQILCSQTNNVAALVPNLETSFAKSGIFLPAFLVGLKMAAR